MLYPWFNLVSVDYRPIDVTQTANVSQTAVAFGGSATNAAVTSLSSNIASV
jgi:hypothetical protein